MDHSTDSSGSSRQQGVLLVDDEPDILDSLKDLLEACIDNVTVHCAASAAEGLRLLEEEQIDVVISDYKMAGMNGLEFLGRAKAMAPDVPRILATAFPDLEIAVRGINEANIKNFITKPFEPEKVIDVVREILQERRADRHARPDSRSLEISDRSEASA